MYGSLNDYLTLNIDEMKYFLIFLPLLDHIGLGYYFKVKLFPKVKCLNQIQQSNSLCISYIEWVDVATILDWILTKWKIFKVLTFPGWFFTVDSQSQMPKTNFQIQQSSSLCTTISYIEHESDRRKLSIERGEDSRKIQTLPPWP